MIGINILSNSGGYGYLLVDNNNKWCLIKYNPYGVLTNHKIFTYANSPSRAYSFS